MTKQRSAARSILALSEEEDSWDFIKEEHDPFIWTDDDDTPERWNEITAKSKLPRVGHRIDSSDKDEREFLTYKGKTVEVPLTHSRDDRLIILHTLARLVREDSDIRFCMDSYHSSNLAFLALPPADWKALEKEFGAKAVAFRFLAFPKDLKKFHEKAFSDENNRRYGDEEEEETPTEKALGALMDEIVGVAKPISPEAGTFRDSTLEGGKALGVLLHTTTDAEREAIRKDRKRVDRMINILTRGCTQLGLELAWFTIQSHETTDRDFKGWWGDGIKTAISLYSRS